VPQVQTAFCIHRTGIEVNSVTVTQAKTKTGWESSTVLLPGTKPEDIERFTSVNTYVYLKLGPLTRE
jgi:hypothetical protein